MRLVGRRGEVQNTLTYREPNPGRPARRLVTILNVRYPITTVGNYTKTEMFEEMLYGERLKLHF